MKNHYERYLKLIGVKQNTPNLELLQRIVRAHLIKIPFENISKLISKKEGMKSIPDLSNFLEGIEKYNFGGTCYTNNYYLYSLLKYLGYAIKLCGADMKNPDVHLLSIVKIENHEYIVDVGYAAPFYEPLPISLTNEHKVNFGNESYIVKPKDDLGRVRVEQHSDGKLQHWYTAKPESRSIKEFKKVIEDSYSDEATFMNAVRITKFLENGSLVLKNFDLTTIKGNKYSTTKVALNDLPHIIQRNFSIPSIVAKDAIDQINEIRDIYD